MKECDDCDNWYSGEHCTSGPCEHRRHREKILAAFDELTREFDEAGLGGIGGGIGGSMVGLRDAMLDALDMEGVR